MPHVTEPPYNYYVPGMPLYPPAFGLPAGYPPKYVLTPPLQSEPNDVLTNISLSLSLSLARHSFVPYQQQASPYLMQQPQATYLDPAIYYAQPPSTADASTRQFYEAATPTLQDPPHQSRHQQQQQQHQHRPSSASE